MFGEGVDDLPRSGRAFLVTDKVNGSQADWQRERSIHTGIFRFPPEDSGP